MVMSFNLLQVFSQMFLLGMKIRFDDFLHVLNSTANELADNVKMLENTGDGFRVDDSDTIIGKSKFHN